MVGIYIDIHIQTYTYTKTYIYKDKNAKKMFRKKKYILIR